MPLKGPQYYYFAPASLPVWHYLLIGWTILPRQTPDRGSKTGNQRAVLPPGELAMTIVLWDWEYSRNRTTLETLTWPFLTGLAAKWRCWLVKEVRNCQGFSFSFPY